MEKIITKFIVENNVMIFSKDYCPFSAKAKAFLKSKSITYFHVDMDLLPDGVYMQKILKNMSGFNQLPIIYVSGKLLGGFEEL